MSIPGLDVARLKAYAASAIPELADPDLDAELIVGGRSNLTYRLRSPAGNYILRRQPLGHVLASAHDMKREFRVISALANPAPASTANFGTVISSTVISSNASPGTEHKTPRIPVPTTVHYCQDPDVIGSPFYVMQDVAGTIFRSSAQLSELGPNKVEAVAFSLIDCLADLHVIDPAEVGLADFGRAEGYNERQLRRWSAQLDASTSRELTGMSRLRESLAANIPNPRFGGIVHGDFRLDNAIFDQADDPVTIAAILDWEMSTLGDPLADLALTLLYTGRPIPSGGGTELDPPPISVPGHPGLQQLIDRYAERTGRDISELHWYRAFAAFKLAAILEGIHFRFIHGQTVGAGFDTMGDLVPDLVEEGLHAIHQSD